MAERYAYSILSLKSERKRLCEGLRCRWEHNANVGLQRGVRVRVFEVGFSDGHDDDDGAFQVRGCHETFLPAA